MPAAEDESLTSLEALSIAIRRELDSRDVYREVAGRCEESLIRRRFELLAAEEERHHAYLVERWREMARGVELKLPPSELPRGMVTCQERSSRTLLEILDMAIEQERHSLDFYLRAAQETADLSGQAMFRFLADLERRHSMDLAQERDLLVRYPNYGRSGPAPWRAEASLTGGERKGT
jgi:rubrerythrin